MDRVVLNRDYRRFIQIVIHNQMERACPRTGKVGCIGQCKNCPKQDVVDKICMRAAGPEWATLFREGKMPQFVFASVDSKDPIGGMMSEERIAYWRGYYATQPPFDDGLEKELEDIDPINEKRRFGRTRLHEAVLAGDEGLIADLIAEGADPDIKDNNGLTPFALAKIEQKKGILKLFHQLEITK